MIENEIVNKAIGYIYSHINETITLDDVCQYCHISKYHFSRLFKKETGESLYSFIKRLKLEQSAFRMKIEKERSITDIAEEYGYSASNYSSAFRLQKNTTPIAYRKSLLERSIEHPFLKEEQKLGSFEECMEKITIEELPEVRVLYERNIGRYNEMGRNWCVFSEKYAEYVTDETVYYECTFDDPSITQTEGCVYDICMSVEDNCSLPNTRMLNGGRFLVYHFEGHVNELYAAYQTIFHVYLPNSKYVVDERYGFDRYHYYREDGTAKIDIHFPIK